MHVSRAIRALSACTVACVLTACATQYRTDVHGDPGYDFGKISRLAIRELASEMPEPAARNNALLHREVRSRLEAKGFEIVPEGAGDLLVYASVDRHNRITLSGNRLAAEEGQIVIYFVVPGSGHTVWYGSIATTVTDATDAQTAIPAAVEELLARFPDRGQDVRPPADEL